MVKIVKTKRKLRIDNLIIMMFIVSCVAYVLSVTVLRAHNVVLAKQENQVSQSISKLENDVAHLEIDVKKLDNRERILEIAEKHGLVINQESIITVVDAAE